MKVSKNQASVMKNIQQNDEAPRDLALSEDREIPESGLSSISTMMAPTTSRFSPARRLRRARETIGTLSKGAGSERTLRMPRWRGLSRGGRSDQVSSLTMEDQLATNFSMSG